MITELGHFSLILSLSLGFALWIPCLGNASPLKGKLLSHSVQTQTTLLGFSLLCLLIAFVRSDFSVQSVAYHSHEATPLIYKIAALWGHHEGSMLLWCWMLCLYGMFFGRNGQKIPQAPHQTTLALLQGIILLFLAYSIFCSNPFERFMPFPINGSELNPLLQDPSVTFHPILLYLGFTGFAIPFSLATSLLWHPQKIGLTLQWCRPWITVSWCFLTLGILSGSWWAYYELGWGGWWFWDPVESCSLVPWLFALALFHAPKTPPAERGHLALASLCFLSCLAGFWVIRGGALISVHNFALDSKRNLFLLGIFFLCLLLAGMAIFKTGKDRNPTNSKGSLLIKIALYLFSYLGFTVLWSIFFPLMWEKATGQVITLGLNYFTKLFCYPTILTFLLMAFAPLSIKSESFLQFIKTQRKILLSVGFLSLLFFAYPMPLSPLGKIAIFSSLWVIIWTLIKGAHALRSKTFLKKSPLYVAHLGAGILALGISVNQFCQQETILTMKVGDTFSMGDFDVELQAMQPYSEKNYLAHRGIFSLKKQGQDPITLRPERRIYYATQTEHSETAIHLEGFTSFSLILGETSNQHTWVVRAYTNPFILLIWMGGILIALSGLFIFLRSRLLKYVLLFLACYGSVQATPSYHPRSYDLFKQFRCPTCQGQTIDTSSTQVAKKMRDHIEALVRKNMSDKAIAQSVEETFQVATPNTHPPLLWAGPLGFLLIVLILYLRKRRAPR